MCGFVGSFRFGGGGVDMALLKRQVRAISHRGPDGEGQWTDGTVGLGHRRLAIFDLTDAGAQPMVSPDGRWVLVYNGEIYNWRTLHEHLAPRWDFRSESDTEVVLAQFAHEGVSSITELEGMFAFALYDTRDQELWLARDPFGIKPLYYHINQRRITFGSEIKPVLLDPETPRRASLSALAQHVLFNFSMGDQTAFDGIKRVQPGELLCLRPDGRVTATTYCHLPDLVGGDTTGEIERLLTTSVRLHVQADVPVGVLLSGGIDSNLILALSRGESEPGLRKAFTVMLGRSEENQREVNVAKTSAAEYGVVHETVEYNDGILAGLTSMVTAIEEPVADLACLGMDIVCRRARREKIPVILAGYGGDELFAGYRRHLLARHIGAIPQRVWSLCADGISAFGAREDGLARTMRAFNSADVNEALLVLVGRGIELVEQYDIAPGLIPRGTLPDVVEQARGFLDSQDHRHPLKRAMLMDLRGYMPAMNLMHVDKVSMQHGIEIRVPFLSRPLAAAALSLPVHRLTGLRVGKLPLRRLAANKSLRHAAEASKTGFAGPLWPAMRSEWVQDGLFGPTTRQRGFFRTAVLKGLYESLRPGDSHVAQTLLTIATIEHWCRSFFDTPGFDPTTAAPEVQC